MKPLKSIFTVSLCILYVIVILLSGSGCTGMQTQVPHEQTTAISNPAASVEKSQNEVQNESSSEPVTSQSSTGNNGFRLDLSVGPENKPMPVNWEPIKYDKLVKPYKISDDLSNITNLDQFGEFSREQMNLLSQNGFVVAPSKEQQLFYIYESNQYLKLPGFITCDSVLQVYHIFFE